MNYDGLLKAKDAAVIDDDAAQADLNTVLRETAEAAEAASIAINAAIDRAAGTAAARSASHRAIHDRLAERGEHSTVSEDGTLTVWRAVEREPGYQGYQPIPGTEPTATAAE